MEKSHGNQTHIHIGHWALDIKILQIKTPSEIIVRPEAHEEQYHSMLKDLSNTYYKITDKSAQIHVGKKVAANLKGDLWLRGVVLEKSTETTVLIYLCDTGEKETLLLENVLPLKQHFLKLPSLAMFIQVDSVIQHFKKVGASIEFAKELLSENKVKIVEAKENVDTENNIKSYTARLLITQESAPDPFGPTEEVTKDYATMLDENLQNNIRECIFVMVSKKHTNLLKKVTTREAIRDCFHQLN